MNHEHQHQGGPGGGCGGEGGDPSADAARMWQGAFQEALRDLQIEILKEKLRRRFGKTLEGLAEDVADILFKEWSGRFKAAVERPETPDPMDELRKRVSRRLGKKAR